jgi:hypothetical protein
LGLQASPDLVHLFLQLVEQSLRPDIPLQSSRAGCATRSGCAPWTGQPPWPSWTWWAGRTREAVWSGSFLHAGVTQHMSVPLGHPLIVSLPPKVSGDGAKPRAVFTAQRRALLRPAFSAHFFTSGQE